LVTFYLSCSTAPGAAGVGGCVFVLEATPFVGGVDGSVRGEVTSIGVLIGDLGNYSG
jgi:hypothetical protein